MTGCGVLCVVCCVLCVVCCVVQSELAEATRGAAHSVVMSVDAEGLDMLLDQLLTTMQDPKVTTLSLPHSIITWER